ncbi:MAG: DNA gyrase inhibitor YacG [Casimicrobiaceae bacterium]
MTAARSVKCPQCGAVVPWTPASSYRPFCSERCRTLDLGAWASGAYRVPVPQSDDGDETGDGGPAGH